MSRLAQPLPHEASAQMTPGVEADFGVRLATGLAKRLLLATALGVSSLASTGCESREEKAVGLLEEMGQAMEKHDGDCDKLATVLTRLRKDNGDAMKALADSDKLGPEERKAFDSKYQKRIDRAMQKMVEHAAACRDNPKIAEAMDVR